jgi:hypothetical protein
VRGLLFFASTLLKPPWGHVAHACWQVLESIALPVSLDDREQLIRAATTCDHQHVFENWRRGAMRDCSGVLATSMV